MNDSHPSWDIKVSHTGIIPAKIQFTEPIRVSWLENGNTTPLGTMELHELSAKNSRATINDTTQFTMTDPDAFGRFSQQLITSSNFTWLLESDNLVVHAASFPVCKGIKFKKELKMPGAYPRLLTYQYLTGRPNPRLQQLQQQRGTQGFEAARG